MNMEERFKGWSKWKHFPNPENLDVLCAPIGPGVYELRLMTGEPILVGMGRCCAYRMSSLTLNGAGTRKNSRKRQFVSKKIDRLEYRTKACATADEAKKIEREMRANCNYRFPT